MKQVILLLLKWKIQMNNITRKIIHYIFNMREIKYCVNIKRNAVENFSMKTHFLPQKIEMPSINNLYCNFVFI